jgi:WD40 repeat protein
MGTPDYIAPEQIRDTHHADARADLYSLGCTLYHLLSGQVPFPDATLGVKLLCHQTEEPRPIEQLRPEVPPALAGVLRRLMAKRPEDRYPTAAQAADALQAVLEGRPPPAPPTVAASSLTFLGLPQPNQGTAVPVPGRRRWPRRAAAGGAVLAGLLLAALLWPRGPQPQPGPSQGAPALTPLDQLEPAAIPEVERFPWQPPALVAVLGQHGLRHPRVVNAVCWDPDGKMVLSTGDDGVIRFWDAATGRQREVLQPVGRAWRLAFSRDGKRLAVAANNTFVRVWEKTAGRFLDPTLLKGPGLATTAVAFAPDASLVAAGEVDGKVRVWRLSGDGAAPADVLEGHEQGVRDVAFSRSGEELFTASYEGLILRWRRRAGAWRRDRTWRQKSGLMAKALSPDGKTLATGSEQGVIRLWDLEKNEDEPSRAFKAHETIITQLAFRPDGAVLGSAGYDGLAKLWDLRAGAPGEPIVLAAPGNNYCNAVAFASDGRAVAAGYQSGKVVIWEERADGWKERHPQQGHLGEVAGLAFTADGRRLFTASNDRIYLWEFGAEAPAPPLSLAPSSNDEVSGMALTATADKVVVSGNRATFLHRLRPGNPFAILESLQLTGQRGAVAISPTEPLLAVRIPDGVRLWWIARNPAEPLAPLETPAGTTHALAISGDGQVLAAGCDDGRVEVWTRKEGPAVGWERRRPLLGHAKAIRGLSLSADGGLLACIDQATVRLWWREGNQWKAGRVQPLGDDQPRAVALAPDGRRMAVACYDGRLLWWDDLEGAPREWKSPGGVRSLEFAPDGRHLAVGNIDGTIYLLRLAAP